MKKNTNTCPSLTDKHYNITYPSLSLSLSLSNIRFLSFSALCPQVSATARLCVAACTSVCMVGLLSTHQAFAATIPLDSLTLGSVIQINGQNFVKIGDNRYLSICGIESNKCPVEGQKWDEASGKCVCSLASGIRQTWTGCSGLATWTEGTSEADNANTVCLLDNQTNELYQVHKYSDNKCYVTSSTSDTPEPLINCPPAITDGYNVSTGKCICKSGFATSPQGICYKSNSTHVGAGICTNPTAYMQDWDGCGSLAQWSATATSGTTACLADQRDGKTYMVRKLPDNRCWMVNNLAYGASDKYNGTDVCADRTTMTSAETNEASIKNKFGGQSNSTTTYGLWGDCRGAKNVADASRDGYYYNWAAAMQQTNTWNGSSNQPANQTNVQGLCPDGWVLPTGGTGASTDFQKLASAVNGTYAANYSDDKTKTFFQNSSYGWHGLYSGNASSTGGLSNQGSNAYYWSSTFGNAYYAYNLRYSSSSVNPEYNDDKNLGFSIRCFRN